MPTLTSTFPKKLPAYRYIRETDKLPTEMPNKPVDDIVCRVRLFNPTGVGTWWIASFDPETTNAWGVAEVHTRETGLIWLQELVDFRGRFGLPIERDLHYKPKTVRQILDEVVRAAHTTRT